MSDPSYGIGVKKEDFYSRLLYIDKGMGFLESARSYVAYLGTKECQFDIDLLLASVALYAEVVLHTEDDGFAEAWAKIDSELLCEDVLGVWRHHLEKNDAALPQLISIEDIPGCGWYFIFDAKECFTLSITPLGEELERKFSLESVVGNTGIWWDTLSQDEFWRPTTS